MGNLYSTITELCAEKSISGYRMCKDVGIQPSIMTDLKSGRKKGLSAETAQKIADYFKVSVGYLLGIEEKEKPAKKASLDDEDIKFALSGGDEPITDAQYEEVKKFVQFIKERDKK